MMFQVPQLNARILSNTLQHIVTSKTWIELMVGQDLDEDLLQAQYNNGLILDVGWYRDTRQATTNVSADGAFWVVLVRNSDWDNPVLSICARDFTELGAAMEAANHWASLVSS